MKIVQKLTLLFIAGTSAVLACNGFFRVRREVALFESDRIQNQDLLASAIATAAGAVWRTDGGERARELVGQLDQRAPKLNIAWVSVDSASPVDARTSEVLKNRSMISQIETGPGKAQRRCTYAPVSVDGTLVVAGVGVCEALAVQQQYVRRTIAETLATTLALAAVCALISATLGFWLVGRPVRELMDKARRIGERDFSRPLIPRSRDELAMLSLEMNTMCDRLAQAAARVESETRSRIAALEQLRHADRLMTVGKLASGLAHELGTPLNVIEARAEMIASGDTSHEESVAYAGVIAEATDRMTRILRQLLDFARRGRSHVMAHEVLSLATRTAELLTPLAAKKQLVLDVKGSTAAALVDPNQIEQVLTNLVVNAIHASRARGRIEVRVSEETVRPPAEIGGAELACVCVRVRDYGVGIPSDDLPHVFEPFFTTKDVGEGTGLGLAVAYGIVRDHGGWIDAASEEGQGAEFTLFLKKASG